MNVVYKRACFAVFMLICPLLAACGNKGDLYLEQVQLTEEQKALLDQLETSENSDEEDDDEEGKNKKSGTTSGATEPAESDINSTGT